jgi:hypothetical protein
VGKAVKPLEMWGVEEWEVTVEVGW